MIDERPLRKTQPLLLLQPVGAGAPLGGVFGFDAQLMGPLVVVVVVGVAATMIQWIRLIDLHQLTK